MIGALAGLSAAAGGAAGAAGLAGGMGDLMGKLAPVLGKATSALTKNAGILQDIKANKLKNQADAALPGFVDPNQSAYLAELAQKRKSIDTGADFASPINTIDSTNAGTNEAIVRSTGGDVGGTIQALLQSQGMANQAKNNAIAQGQQQQMQYNQMYGGLLDRVAQRKMELQMYRSQQARAEWAKMKQQANQNNMAKLARAPQQQESDQSAEGSPLADLGGNQQGMDWSNPQGMLSGIQTDAPMMMQGGGGLPSIDLSVLDGGNALTLK